MFAIFRSFLVSEDLVFLQQQQRALVPALYTHLSILIIKKRDRMRIMIKRMLMTTLK